MKIALPKNLVNIIFWTIFIFVVAYAILVAPYAPENWQDEDQIIELGRQLIWPTDWSGCWTSIPESSGKFLYAWGVGPALQAVAFECLGWFGHRYLGIAFWVAAILLCAALFSRKSGKPYIGYFCGLVLLLAPNAIHGAVGGRCDVHGFAFLFLSLLMMEYAKTTINDLHRYLFCIIAGISAALCVFTWPTMVIYAPILLWEFIDTNKEHRFSEGIRSLFVVGLSAGIVSLILLIPAMKDFNLFKCYNGYVVACNSGTKTFQLGALLYDLFRTDGFYLVGILGLFLDLRKNILVILGSFVFLAFCSVNRIYGFRLVYLLPYALIGLYTILKKIHGTRRLVLFTCFYGLVFLEQLTTPISDFWLPYLRNYNSFANEIATVIPKGSRVYIDSWNMYFIGRENGWLLYKTYSGKREEVLKCVGEVDWCVVQDDKWSAEHKNMIEGDGFECIRSIEPKLDHPTGSLSRLLTCLNRTRSLGCFSVYKRCERGK